MFYGGKRIILEDWDNVWRSGEERLKDEHLAE